MTGATVANFTALAAARHAVLGRVGWDAESQGLFGAPAIQVVVGEEVLVVGPPVGEAHGGTADPLGVGPGPVCQGQAAGDSAHACRPNTRGTFPDQVTWAGT